MKFELILGASALGAEPDLVLQNSEVLARLSGARCRVVHVVAGDAAPEEVAGRRAALEERAGRCGVCSGHATTLVGRPFEAIAAHARELKADLLVVGRGGVPGRPGTQTLDRILRTSYLPCLVTSSGLSEQIRRMVVAVDASEHALRAARTAADLAASFVPGAAVSIHLLHISEIGRHRGGPEGGHVDLAGIVRRTWRRANAVRRGACTEVTHSVYSAETVSAGIAAFLADDAADMIVLGTHSHSPLIRMIVGSVALEAVRTLTMPVLLVPPPSSRKGQSR